MTYFLTNQNYRKTLLSCLVGAVFAFLAVGCSKPADKNRGAEDDGTGGYAIVATTGMIADVVRHVAGDLAEVNAIMGEGTDPHLYTPTRSDVLQLSDADVIFYNGLLLEGRMGDVLAQMNKAGKPVVAVAEVVDEKHLLDWSVDNAQANSEKHYDPHVWMDVQAWISVVKNVRDTLAEFDSGNAHIYETNTEQYVRELELLDEYARAALQSVPENQRVLITAHDAFSYFGRAYDIQVRGIQGISTESEAGVRDINELVQFLVQQNIQAVFVETSVADKNVRALVEGARSHGHDVKIGGSLFSDAMGSGGSWEGTYIGMIDHNVTTITRALGGTVPPGGFRQWREQMLEQSASPSGENN